ncbi:MAG: hypothetical protein IT463_07000 [Planctomycetes bacterium]|nr:hypothetical protein [Planctomycetota bacterium]
MVGTIALPSGRVIRLRSKLGSDVGILWCLFKAQHLPVRWLKSAPLVTSDRFFDALALLFANNVTALVREGKLRRFYVETVEPLVAVRGRLLPAATFASGRMLPTPIVCRYDDFTTDMFQNQVLRVALQVAEHLVSEGVRSTVANADALLRDEVSTPLMRPADAVQRLRLLQASGWRGLADYRAALDLATLVLEQFAPADYAGPARSAPTLLLNMERLFEDALRAVVKGRGTRLRRVEFDRENLQFTPTPDIETDDLIVDAKYKAKPLVSSPHGRRVPIAADFYQACFYSSWGKRSVALVYALGALGKKHYRELPAICKDARVGLFPFCIAGSSVGELEQEAVQLRSALDRFRRDQSRSA